MLIYLSKKIAIPGQINLNCITWNRDQGWIACGGESGLLKVLKLETPTGPDAKIMGIAAPSNLSMNQTLEGHNGKVICATWNPVYKKLTTSDENGLIIVWMLHKGLWWEEMINNRNKSVVKDMKWTVDGKKICIIYEDGAVIVGSVDGNRLWGKELNLELKFVEWSPDSKYILFVTSEVEVWVYDADGSKLRLLSLASIEPFLSTNDYSIAAIHWYSPPYSTRTGTQNVSSTLLSSEISPSLLVAFDNGLILLSRGEFDNEQIVLDTELEILSCKWNSQGNIFAVTGILKPSRNDSHKVINLIKFYDSFGKFLRGIRIPGENIAALTWEGSGLRIALAVESFIFFANIRPSYTWTYLQNTVVYAQLPKFDNNRKDSTVIFWDLTTYEAYTKIISNLKFLVSYEDICAVVWVEKSYSNVDVPNSPPRNTHHNNTVINSSYNLGYTQEVYHVQLRNAIGAVLDSKTIPFQPRHCTMGPYLFVATNERTVFTWQFSNLTGTSSKLNYNLISAVEDNDDNKTSPSINIRGMQSRVRLFDIENTSIASAQPPENFRLLTDPINDRITCSAASDKFVLIARKSGSITRYMLPHLNPENSYSLKCEPFRVSFNSNSSKLAVIDINGMFSIFDLEAKLVEGENSPANVKTLKNNSGKTNNFEDSVEDNDISNNSPSITSPSIDSAAITGGSGLYYGKKITQIGDRKDVWDMKWAEDNPDMICIMEKTKMVVFRDDISEEPTISSGYIARFKDLEIKAVSLDDLTMSNINSLSNSSSSNNNNSSNNKIALTPEQLAKECIITFESKLLREMRERVSIDGLIQGGLKFADSQIYFYPRLWQLLAQFALEELDLSTAERAFVKIKDYYGIQLVKQLKTMVLNDKMKARAEVAVYLNKFDEAESIYREIDRKDLAIQMRMKIGDYSRVIQLLQTSVGGNNDISNPSSSVTSDALVIEAYNNIGDYYRDRFQWKKAAECYQLSSNFSRLAETYYHLQAFDELSELRKMIPSNFTSDSDLSSDRDSLSSYTNGKSGSTGIVSSYQMSTIGSGDYYNELLLKLASYFESVGMVNDAVDCYLRSGQSKQAIDCCVTLNHWETALTLAEQYNYPQVEGLLNKFASELISSGKKLQAVELYRKANRPTEAALLIGEIAEIAARKDLKPSFAKKLHVLAALEIERHRKRATDQLVTQTLGTMPQQTMYGDTIAAGGRGGTIAQATAATLETLMMSSLDTQMTGGTTTTANKKASKAFGNAWRGAAAYHYYMLAQRQFYDGNLDAAMKTCIKLCEYDDILEARDIYRLLCLTSLRNKFYSICSKAFVKLETLAMISEDERDEIQTLAVKIFVNHSPVDPTALPDVYMKCLDMGKTYKACVITGRAILDSESYMCRTCRHLMLERERLSDGKGSGLTNCPLCHSPMVQSNASSQHQI